MLQMQSIVVFIFRISSFILLSVSVGIAVSICIIAAIGAAASIGIIAFIGATASIGITVCTVIFKFFHNDYIQCSANFLSAFYGTQ